MPILEYHLTEGRHTDEQIAELVLASSHLYAEVLPCPIERVRVAVHLHRPQHVAIGGRLVSEGGAAAPWFHFLVLEGRPVEAGQQLLAGFTDLLVRTLGVERPQVRGGCRSIPPEHWAIGGTPASVLRATEIRARAEAGVRA